MEYYIWFFIIFSFFGWVLEVAYSAVRHGRCTNRGFLNGPVCPLYGVGAVLLSLALTPVQDNLLLLFGCSVLLMTLLELVTGYVLEHFFHHRWWDYSKERFQFRGYICLRFSLIWGALCIVVVRFLLPPVRAFVEMMPMAFSYAVGGVIFALFLADLYVTVGAIASVNHQISFLEEISGQLRNSSDQIGGQVYKTTISLKEEYDEMAKKSTLAMRRVFASFTDIKSKKYYLFFAARLASMKQEGARLRKRWHRRGGE